MVVSVLSVISNSCIEILIILIDFIDDEAWWKQTFFSCLNSWLQWYLFIWPSVLWRPLHGFTGSREWQYLCWYLQRPKQWCWLIAPAHEYLPYNGLHLLQMNKFCCLFFSLLNVILTFDQNSGAFQGNLDVNVKLDELWAQVLYVLWDCVHHGCHEPGKLPR